MNRGRKGKQWGYQGMTRLRRRAWTTKRCCSIALPDHRALIVVYEPPFEELSLLALVRLAAVCWPSGLGHSPCRPNFPPLLSLSCFERFALSTFFVYTCTRAGAPSCHCAHLPCICSVRLTSSDYAPAGASAWGCCPLFALLVLAGAAFRPAMRVGEGVPIKPASSPAGMVIFQPG